MQPADAADRVLMQELRDGATFAYLRGVVAGHPGCITTLHAGSAKGAFDALRLMIRQHHAGATLGDADVVTCFQCWWTSSCIASARGTSSGS